VDLAKTLVSLAIGALGCREASEAPRVAPPAAPSRAVESPLDAARRLALAPVSGSSAVDVHIARLHELARAEPRRAGHFIELGRAWVGKARQSSDPGYYLNANACADVALDLAPDDRLALELRALVLLNGWSTGSPKRSWRGAA
jgi:hypothetical protein